MGGRCGRLELEEQLLNPACSGIFYFISMREELLHFIWRYAKFKTEGLKTTDGLRVRIRDAGRPNSASGPDFFNACIEIGGQTWVGNVEIHVKSSDWYAHRHHKDRAYQNVILHVVWTNDRLVLRTNGQPLPTIELRDYVDADLLDRFRHLLVLANKKFINCEAFTGSYSIFLVLPWLEQLFHERLKKKTVEAQKILVEINWDWEHLLVILLLKYFGQQVNKENFLGLARRMNYSMMRRIAANTFQLESILFGQIGLLSNNNRIDTYYQSLQKEYYYLKRKYSITDIPGIKPEFMGVRPMNFPTIRLSQFAVLISRNQNLFSRLLKMETKKQYYELFGIKATSYWDNHHIFGKTTAAHPKRLSKKFTDSLILNAILPLKYLYYKEKGRDYYLQVRSLAASIGAENNSLIQKFKSLGFPTQNGLDSQALIQLYNDYCIKNRCLDCALGNQILN